MGEFTILNFRGEGKDVMGGGDPIAAIGSQRLMPSPQRPRMGFRVGMKPASTIYDNILKTSFCWKQLQISTLGGGCMIRMGACSPCEFWRTQQQAGFPPSLCKQHRSCNTIACMPQTRNVLFRRHLLLVSLVVVTSIRNKSILYKYLFASRPSASAQESLSFRGIQKWCLWLNHSSRVSCSRNIDDGAIPFCAREFMLCGALVCSDILAKWYEIIRLEMIKVCDSCSSIARDNRRTIDLIREIVPWRNKYYSH